MKARFGIAAASSALAAMMTLSVCHADDSATAQALFDQGKKAMAAHHFAEACSKFDESFRIDPGLGTLLNLADCYERQGKLATSWSKFLELSAKARAVGQSERARIGRERAAALAPRLSNLEINVPASSRIQGLQIQRDGTPVGEAQWGAAIPADPGPHSITASAPGRKPQTNTVVVTEGATTTAATIPLLEPNPPVQAEPVTRNTPRAQGTSVGPGDHDADGQTVSHSRPQKTVGLVIAGVGTAGLSAGGVFAILSWEKHQDASKECPTSSCATVAGSNSWRQAIRYGNVATIALVAGGAVLVGGLTLWLTTPRAEKPLSARTTEFGISPDGIQLRGTW